MSAASDWIARQLNPVTTSQTKTATVAAISQIRADYPIVDYLPEILGALAVLQLVMFFMIVGIWRNR